MMPEIVIPEDLVDDIYIEKEENTYFVRSVEYGLIHISCSPSTVQAYLDYISANPLTTGIQ